MTKKSTRSSRRGTAGSALPGLRKQTSSSAIRTSMSVGTGDEKDCACRGWLLHREVAQLLRMDTRTLRRLMQATPEGIERPWVNTGTTKRPSYRWKADDIEPWVKEVNRWPTRKDMARSGVSVGGDLMGDGGAGSAPTRRRPTRSRGKSNRPTLKDDSGILTQFVKSLPSRES